MDKSKLQEFKKRLEKESEKLIGELKRFAKPDPHLAGNWQTQMPDMDHERTGEFDEESADQTEEFENLIAIEHNLESRLQEVTQALERIGKEGFGICTNCKKPIPEQRLEANPAAKNCLQC